MMTNLPVEVILALSGPIWAGAGWLLARRLTGAKHREQTENLLASVDLVSKLRGAGLSIAEVKQITSDLQAGHLPPALQHNVDNEADDEPEAYGSTMAMKFRISAKQDTLDAQMAEVIVDLELLLQGEEGDLAIAAQKAWEEYRHKEATFYSSLAAGGTAEGLLYLASSTDLTAARIEQLKEQVRERRLIA